MLSQIDFDALRLELSVKAKNGLDFIVAASVLWALISVVWALPYPPALLGSITFGLSGLMLPLAWGMSKVFRTTWTLPNNPLQPLGLWLNFAQLFYFPLLIFIFSYHPAYFIMTYGIITGAHFFPYAWFYKAPPFAVLAGIISVGCLLIGLRTATTAPFWVPVFVLACLLVLAGLLRALFRQRAAAYQMAGAAQ